MNFSFCLSTKLKLPKKLSKLLLMCLTFHARITHFFGMPKRKSIYAKYLCLLLQKTFSQAYLIWAPKLDVPKIGIPLSKRTQNTPCNYSVHLHKTFYSLWIIRLCPTNHGSSTFCFFTHPLFFVFLIMNKIYLNRWKKNS